ncbi:MAG: hypothetical protein LBC21_04655 [Oscillospiraceae bacterium]|jgi:hypothetical protein|nr:hypothetical protein [Oscillospiraceae bacterium]
MSTYMPDGDSRTIGQVIADIDGVCPNAFSEDVKARWIAQLDMLIWRDLFLQAPLPELDYNWPECADWQVLVAAPDDDIYDLYLRAQVEFHNGEYEKYDNTMAYFNSRYREFSAWFINLYRPAYGYVERGGRGITGGG